MCLLRPPRAVATLLAVLATAATAAAPPALLDTPYPGTVRRHVDATDLAHRVFVVHEEIPVRAGPLTLLYPRFIPGNHGPTGPVERVAGLQVTAGERRLPWLRDTADPYAFHLDVPRGTSQIAVDFQYLSPIESGSVVMTREMLRVEWEALVLYPAGWRNSAVAMQAALRAPAGWQLAGALPVATRDGAETAFTTVSLETLVDSPLYAGLHVRRIELDPPGTAHPVALDLFADSAGLLEASDAQLQAHRNSWPRPTGSTAHATTTTTTSCSRSATA